MDNTFSIITITKNNAQGLQHTLHSIVNQTYQHYEIIVIDGDSIDSTSEVLSHYSNSTNKVISEPDSGIYDAMNKGLSLAEHQWTLFLNAGDIFCNTSVLENVATFISQQSIMPQIIFGATEEQLHGQVITRHTMPLNALPAHMPACHQSTLIWTELLAQYPFDTSFTICGDLEQLSRILHTMPHLPVAYYKNSIAQIEGEGTSNTLWKTAFQERVQVQTKYFNTLQHTAVLQRYYRTVFIKKILRSCMPLSLQLFIRKLLHRHK